MVLAILTAHSVQAVNWDNFRGPGGDGISPEQGLTTWPASGPRLIWKSQVNNGFSTFSVHGGKAYTQVTRTMGDAEREVCLALDAATGAELWAVDIDRTDYDSGSGEGDGPRSTPVYYEGRIFVLSSFLVLVALDANSGQELWRKDLANIYGGEAITWQNSASPVISDGLIFLNANGSPNTILALSVTDGSLVWKATKEPMTHATPVFATIHGIRQLIFLTQNGLLSLNPADGTQLWRYTFPYNTSTGASPVVCDDMVYCSAAYGVGAAVAKISLTDGKFSAQTLWSNSQMNHWSTPVCYNGYLYGLYGNGAYNTAPLKCLEMASGVSRWSRSGFGLGGLILAEGKLIVQSDVGEIALVEASPTAYKELARFQAVDGKSWNAPALSNGRLYARSISEAACYELYTISQPPLRWMAYSQPAANRFAWFINSSDDTAIDASRLSKISVLTSSSASTNSADWTAAEVQMTLTNGTIRVDGAIDAATPLRLYRIAEQP